MSSTHIPLIRAAAQGDAGAVSALLADGADVNVSTLKGVTALIGAAFFGHADVVRVLLHAGADVRMKDYLGLTATEWSIRRGFDEVTRLLQDTPPAGPKTPGMNAAEEDYRQAAEVVRQQGEEPAEIKGREERQQRANPAQRLGQSTEPLDAQTATARGAHDPQAADALLDLSHVQPAALAADFELDLDSDETPLPAAMRQATPAGQGVAGVASDEDEITSSVKAAGAIAEEVRERADAEAHQKSEEVARRHYEDVMYGEPTRPASTLGHTAQETPTGSGVRRCPKCNSTYRSDILAYCLYDSVRLISDDEPSVTAAVEPYVSMRDNRNVGRPWAPILIALALLGGGLIGYQLNRSFTNQIPAAPGSAQTAPASVQPDQPVTDGALKGKEIRLPSPEYPEVVKSEGVSGNVTVAVVVNKKGDVISARPLNGHPLLRVAAVKAAREAKFSSEKLAGGAAKVSGTITYNFK
ncbi:MAG TPA: TonB family protein [Pyrinomonadaceae bacterium]